MTKLNNMEKIKQVINSIALSASNHDSIDEDVKELLTLIQESNDLEKFRSFCENEVPEKRLSDEHYCLVSLLIDSYLSSKETDNGKGNP